LIICVEEYGLGNIAFTPEGLSVSVPDILLKWQTGMQKKCVSLLPDFFEYSLF